MTTQPHDPKTESLALLGRIATATEAHARRLDALAEQIAELIEITHAGTTETTNTSAALEQIAGSLARTFAPPAPAHTVTAGSPSQPEPVAASPDPDQPGGLRDFDADAITLSYDDAGKAVYKARGPLYPKYGVRVWPETLPFLGINPDELKVGPNLLERRLTLRAEMGERGPRKVIGLGGPGH